MQIKNAESMRKFIEDVDGLHDALLHEAVLLHPGYVDSRRRMFGDSELPDAKLLFQSQSPDISAVEIRLRGVSKFQLDPLFEFRLEGEVSNSEIVLFLCGRQHQSRCEIRSKAAEYAVLGGDYLGPEYRLIKT